MEAGLPAHKHNKEARQFDGPLALKGVSISTTSRTGFNPQVPSREPATQEAVSDRALAKASIAEKGYKRG